MITKGTQWGKHLIGCVYSNNLEFSGATTLAATVRVCIYYTINKLLFSSIFPPLFPYHYFTRHTPPRHTETFMSSFFIFVSFHHTRVQKRHIYIQTHPIYIYHIENFPWQNVSRSIFWLRLSTHISVLISHCSNSNVLSIIYIYILRCFWSKHIN